jgi:hypothetical protein
MKKLLIILIFSFIIIQLAGNKLYADIVGTSIEDMNIDQSILTKIKNLGIDVQNAVCTETDPDKIIGYDDFVKEDIDSQVNELTWSTIHRNKLNKLGLITKSSSTLKEYPVKNLFDNRIDTAWVEGAKGDGIGEWISIELNPAANSTDCPIILYYFGMIPGYLKSDKTWEENNRIKSALLIIDRHRNDAVGQQDDYINYAILRLKFNDFKGFQAFNIDYYDGFIATSKKIWIVIEDVYKGTKYNDTCISEMAVGGGIPVYFFEP